jgi:hypothetical protein
MKLAGLFLFCLTLAAQTIVTYPSGDSGSPGVPLSVIALPTGAAATVGTTYLWTNAVPFRSPNGANRAARNCQRFIFAP